MTGPLWRGGAAGARATGVTLSREGKKYCEFASKETGVPTEILLCDYR